jgi:hypothetical protein
MKGHKLKIIKYGKIIRLDTIMTEHSHDSRTGFKSLFRIDKN